MALNSLPVFVQTPKCGLVQFLQGTDVAGTYKTIVTAGANGSKVTALWETNSDASATHLITVQIKRSSVKYGGIAVTTSVSDGMATAVPPKNLMTVALWPGLPIDSDGNPYLLLESGDVLEATFATAMTAGAVINLTAVAADF